MLSRILKPENVIPELESRDKDSLFAELVENLVRTTSCLDRGKILSSLYEREEKMNTCVMKGIAVLHASDPGLECTKVVVGLSAPGIDYEIDGTGSMNYEEGLVHLVFLILFKSGTAESHLKVLADFARLLQLPDFYSSVLAARSVQEVCGIISTFESES